MPFSICVRMKCAFLIFVLKNFGQVMLTSLLFLVAYWRVYDPIFSHLRLIVKYETGHTKGSFKK